MIYRKKWHKRWTGSLLSYFRDLLIHVLPARLPRWALCKLYGFEPQFTFVVHPRRKEDIFIALPFLRPIRAILPKKLRYSFIQSIPPFVLGKVVVSGGANGLIIASTKLPQYLMAKKKKSLAEARRCLRFASKISKPGSSLGLGGWWPMVTRRGLALKNYATKKNIRITSGHAGTLCSVYLMVKKISTISSIPLESMDVLILGNGKMGTAVARVLNGQINKIYLYDINQKKAQRLCEELASSEVKITNTKIEIISEGPDNLYRAMTKTHLCVCTTSNMNRVVKPHSLPPNTLIIDDSRPEAFSRVSDALSKTLVIEGGLMKIKGLQTDYNFGFGKSANVFGCLGEAYLLARDNNTNLLPTLGEVTSHNFGKMLSVLERYEVEVGDFKTSNLFVSDDEIKNIIKRDPSSLFESRLSA